MFHKKNDSKYHWIHLLEEDEVAREVPDAPGYFVTSHARVYSTITNRFLTPKKKQRYYHQVDVKIPNTPPRKMKSYYLHTLVGRLHLPLWEPGLEIHHIDEELPFPAIHSVSNLRVGTHQQNLKDAWQKGRVRGLWHQKS